MKELKILKLIAAYSGHGFQRLDPTWRTRRAFGTSSGKQRIRCLPVGRGGDGWGCSHHHLVGAEQRTLGNAGHYWSHCTGGGCCEAVVLLVQPQILLRVRAMLFERFAHVLFFCYSNSISETKKQ